MPTRSRLKAESGSPPDAEQVSAPPSQAHPSVERIGQVIDKRYRIDSLIAEGGMGVVFLAHDLRLDRSVAVKILHPATSSVPDGELRFQREAKAIARLDHANCLSIQDYGHLEDGTLFLVTPYLEGTLLSEAIAGKPMAAGRALHIAHHLLRGIMHAHAAGIIHRDIKPDNILLVQNEGDSDFPVLLDFGIAKISSAEDAENEDEKDAGAQLTRVGQRFGTPTYMSPEQVTGTRADARSDLYSLSVVIFEMLAGQAPFPGESEETMLLHVTQAPPTLAESAPQQHFSAALEQLVARGLSKAAESRFQSATAYLRAVDSCCGLRELTLASDAPAPAARVKASAKGPMPERASAGSHLRLHAVPKYRRWAAGIMAVVVLAVVVLLLWPDSKASPNHAKRAEELLAAGKPAEAAAFLEELGPAISKRGKAMLQLGHAYAALRSYSKALSAYQRAHTLKRELGDDRVMRANLLLMLDDDRDDTASLAGRFLVETLRDEAASTKIVELASGHRVMAHRLRMRELAEALHLGGEIDRVKSYQLDLLQEDECEDRIKVVAQLRSLGDPEAINALRKSIKRPKNGCLHAAAEDAIHYLQSLEGAQVATP